jgi:hypothetical protein
MVARERLRAISLGSGLGLACAGIAATVGGAEAVSPSHLNRAISRRLIRRSRGLLPGAFVPSEEEPMSVSDLELRRARAARNEVIFRQVNNRIDELNVRLGSKDEVSQYVCECLDPACVELIAIPHDQYERVRRNPTEFVVGPGHERVGAENSVSAANQAFRRGWSGFWHPTGCANSIAPENAAIRRLGPTRLRSTRD